MAKILIFQFDNFDFFLVKHDYFNNEKRTRWIVRVEKWLILDSETKTNIGILENVNAKIEERFEPLNLSQFWEYYTEFENY